MDPKTKVTKVLAWPRRLRVGPPGTVSYAAPGWPEALFWCAPKRSQYEGDYLGVNRRIDHNSYEFVVAPRVNELGNKQSRGLRQRYKTRKKAGRRGQLIKSHRKTQARGNRNPEAPSKLHHPLTFLLTAIMPMNKCPVKHWLNLNDSIVNRQSSIPTPRWRLPVPRQPSYSTNTAISPCIKSRADAKTISHHPRLPRTTATIDNAKATARRPRYGPKRMTTFVPNLSHNAATTKAAGAGHMLAAPHRFIVGTGTNHAALVLPRG